MSHTFLVFWASSGQDESEEEALTKKKLGEQLYYWSSHVRNEGMGQFCSAAQALLVREGNLSSITFIKVWTRKGNHHGNFWKTRWTGQEPGSLGEKTSAVAGKFCQLRW